jgi:hypothetical protein
MTQNELIHVDKTPRLDPKERQFVDYVRANPGSKLSLLAGKFNISDIENFVSSIEHKGILFGENDECIEIIKENGKFKNE